MYCCPIRLERLSFEDIGQVKGVKRKAKPSVVESIGRVFWVFFQVDISLSGTSC